MIPAGETYVCRITGLTIRPEGEDSSVGYILEESCFGDGEWGEERAWEESSLHKIYPTSKYSFEDLLSEIKSCNMNTIEQ